MNFKIAGVIASLICAIGFADEADATLINFDTDAGGAPLVAPALFIDAQPLTTLYSSLGATWAGGGGILDSTTFSVAGFSSPNFLAYNSFATFENGDPVLSSDTLTFSTPQGTVSFLVGAPAPFGDTFTATAFDAAMNIVDIQQITLTPTLQLLTLSNPSIASVSYSSEGAIFVVDNFDFQVASQVSEPTSFAMLAFALVGLGFVARRREN